MVYSEPHEMECCGIFSIWQFIDEVMTFQEFMEECRKILKKRHWKGKIDLNEQTLLLVNFGIDYDVIDFDFRKKNTLESVIKDLDPEAEYIVTIHEHVFVLRGNMYMDQNTRGWKYVFDDDKNARFVRETQIYSVREIFCDY